MSQTGGRPSKTMLRRVEQYRDRWTSYGANTGITALSDKLSPEKLREFEIFSDLDDKFLERISPDVSVAIWEEGAVLFEEGSYLDLAFYLVEGEVEVSIDRLLDYSQSQPIFDLGRTGILRVDELAEAQDKLSGSETMMARSSQIQPGGTKAGSQIAFLAAMDFNLPKGAGVRLGPGEIFGEIGALSGWPQSVTVRTVEPSTLVQIRIPALRALKRKSPSLKRRLDRLYRERSLSAQLKLTPLFRNLDAAALDDLKERVELVSCEPGEVVVQEGETAEDIFLVRSGFLKLLQRFGARDLAVTYLSKGMTLGEVELLTPELERWETTAVSVEYSELVRIPGKALRAVLSTRPETEELLWESAVARIKEAGFSKRNISHAHFTQQALETGLVQGNSMLVIDLERCTRCDDCVRACADTHGGRPRFVREGNRHQHLLLAKSCYHCRDPVCLVGCPTGAIHRSGIDEVIDITDELCIGCATCSNNCPYDAIVMHDTGETWPEDMVPTGLRGRQRNVASKCDLCHTTGHEPACVSNCPQGCAYRVGSVEALQQLLEKED